MVSVLSCPFSVLSSRRLLRKTELKTDNGELATDNCNLEAVREAWSLSFVLYPHSDRPGLRCRHAAMVQPARLGPRCRASHRLDRHQRLLPGAFRAAAHHPSRVLDRGDSRAPRRSHRLL